jgi:hypothetical protein
MPAAIDVSTLDDNDIRVDGMLVSFTGVDITNDGTPRTASYLVSAPGGSWDTADNGSYSVTMQVGQVADTDGRFVAAGNLGNIVVNIVEDRIFNDEFETP